MAIFKRTVVEVDPLDRAIDKGRSVRGLLTSYVNDLDESSALHDEVIDTEQSKVREAQGRIEIAQKEKALNVALANNLRTTLGLQD